MNIKINRQHLFATLFLFQCCLIAWYLKPKITWFEHIGNPNYEKIIPHAFGDWVDVSDQFNNQIIDPQQLYALNNIYTQIVSRTYLHQPTGRKVMLSVAYGDNQTFSKQLHRPESCYSSQGYKILDFTQEPFNMNNHQFEINRFTGITNNRTEQVSYYIRIGDRIISGPTHNLNIARIQIGLKGFIADGLLFRVSEVNNKKTESVKLINIFISDLALSLNKKTIHSLFF